MKTLLLLLVLAAGVFVYPMLREGAGGQCDALEKLGVRVATDRGVPAQLLQSLSNGRMADVMVRSRYPDLPPGIACTLLYWKAAFDPDAMLTALTGKPQGERR